MYIPSGISGLYLVGRFGVVILAVGLAISLVGGEAPEGPDGLITFSFNNADKSVIDSAWPILNQYDYTANIYVAVDEIGKGDKLSTEDLKFLYERGWEIGASGLSYSNLTELEEDKLAEELAESKRILQEIIPDDAGFVVASGMFNNKVLEKITDYYYANVVIDNETDDNIDKKRWVNSIPMEKGNFHQIKALNVQSLTVGRVINLIDQVGKGEWLILSFDGVGSNSSWTEEDFSYLVEYIADKNEFVPINKNVVRELARIP